MYFNVYKIFGMIFEDIMKLNTHNKLTYSNGRITHYNMQVPHIIRIN